MLSFWCLHDVMTSWRDVMTSQNSFLLYQLVDVLKWWYACIFVDISVEGFQTIMVSACKCARALISFLFLWFLWWLNSTWSFSLYLHDGITSRNDVMTSLNMLYLFQRWFFFCFYNNLGCQIQKIIDFVFSYVVMSQRDAMTSWHNYMTSQNSFQLY